MAAKVFSNTTRRRSTVWPLAGRTLELYGTGAKAFVFVHGGAWKRQSKRENAFATQCIVAADATYVALDGGCAITRLGFVNGALPLPGHGLVRRARGGRVRPTIAETLTDPAAPARQGGAPAAPIIGR